VSQFAEDEDGSSIVDPTDHTDGPEYGVGLQQKAVDPNTPMYFAFLVGVISQAKKPVGSYATPTCVLI
jgi:hypothetical protein